MTVGILALQGDFREHEEMLRGMGVETCQVRLPNHLDHIERLIIPGGESTTISKLLAKYNLVEPLRQRIGSGLPVMGTCAGTILLARTISSGAHAVQSGLGVMDIVVQRNGFGRQIDSFESLIHMPRIGELPMRGVFIRAPVIESVADHVEVLARLAERDTIVAARQGKLLVATFHPELTSDDRFHRYFLNI